MFTFTKIGLPTLMLDFSFHGLMSADFGHGTPLERRNLDLPKCEKHSPFKKKKTQYVT